MGRTVPRFIGQAGLEVHRRPRAVDSASSHVMANVGVARAHAAKHLFQPLDLGFLTVNFLDQFAALNARIVSHLRTPAS
jgi:hypothetical protein